MSLVELWRRTAHRSLDSQHSQPGGNVSDELMFHFSELVNEHLAQGATFDSAWEQAEQKFGPMRRYEEECRTERFARRWTRIHTALLLCVIAVLAGCVTWAFRREAQNSIQSLREEVATLRQERDDRGVRPRTIEPEQRIVGGFDLNGVVLDDAGHPLNAATLLIIRKTWPGGGYRQEAFTTTTNDQGQFSMPEFVPGNDQYAIQIAALKEGFAFQSVYQLKDKQPIESPDPIAVHLERASVVTLAVRDSEGRPVANAQVIPSARKSRLGEGHMIYFHGSQAVAQATDADGKVRLNCFLTGDRAEIYVRLPGEDWNNREFDVASDNQLIDLASTMAIDANDGE